MSKPKVYVHRISAQSHLCLNPDNLARLKEFCDPVIAEPGTRPAPPDKVIQDLQGAVALLSINGSGAPDVTGEALKAVGSVKVAVIAHWWHNMIPIVETWRQAGVKVVEASEGNTDAVAEWTLGCALVGVRRILDYDRALKSGSKWGREPERGLDSGLLAMSTVGVAGFGRIGRRVTQLLKAFNANVIVFDPFVSEQDIASVGARKVDKDELFRQSDVITFHVPVNPSTTRMFGARELGLLKDGVVFIDAGRNQIFDDEALINEIRKNRFRAFLDVFEREPLAEDHPYRFMDNTVITPHVAGAGSAHFIRCGQRGIEALRRELAAPPQAM